MQRHLRAEILDMNELVDLPEELLKTAGDQINVSGPARTFWQMCDRFSDNKALYVLYRRLSNSVHPSLRTYAEHLDFAGDQSKTVVGISQDSCEQPEDDLVVSLAFSAMFALHAVESLRRGRARIATVESAGVKWQVPVGLAAEDRHPELQRQIE